jgi:putative tricarboxylic transport membrane protein
VKHNFEPAPLVLGWVLGPLMEENLRRSILLSHGDYTVFFTQPISGALLAIAAAILVVAVLPAIRKKREVVFVED